MGPQRLPLQRRSPGWLCPNPGPKETKAFLCSPCELRGSSGEPCDPAPALLCKAFGSVAAPGRQGQCSPRAAGFHGIDRGPATEVLQGCSGACWPS